jgi:hypothetical protein
MSSIPPEILLSISRLFIPYEHASIPIRMLLSWIDPTASSIDISGSIKKILKIAIYPPKIIKLLFKLRKLRNAITHGADDAEIICSLQDLAGELSEFQNYLVSDLRSETLFVGDKVSDEDYSKKCTITKSFLLKYKSLKYYVKHIECDLLSTCGKEMFIKSSPVDDETPKMDCRAADFVPTSFKQPTYTTLREIKLAKQNQVKGKRVLLNSGKWQGKYGTIQRWNGTSCLIRIDGHEIINISNCHVVYFFDD